MERFTALAQCYDRFVGADYLKIVSYIDRSIKTFAPGASLVCDVGCGSGTVSLGLFEKGYDMIGVDGSAEMLTKALEKRNEISGGDKVLFLCQQLPRFELYGTVDVLISTLDTLNYLTDPADLNEIFYWFHNYLNPGGILIFDINTLYKYQCILDQHCESMEDEEIFLNWSSQFDGTFCMHLLTLFTKTGNDLYRREEEEQLQRYYAPMEIESILKHSGFQILKMVDDYSDRAVGTETQRITYIARKAN